MILFSTSILIFIIVLITKRLSKRNTNQTNRDTWMLSIGILSGIFLLIILFRSFGIDSFSAETGWMGDTIGGVTAPFINGLSAILVFLALKAQVDANTLVQDQILKQEKNDELNIIESRFFELLKLHRENVSEIGIGEDFGRKIFVILIREFREIHKQLKILAKINEITLTNEEYFEISFITLFFGVGPNSSRQLKQALNHYDPNFVSELESRLDNKSLKEKIKHERKLKYNPFEGHQSRLGHYYRHLYQTVNFIHQQKDQVDKYSYTKTLRAQLSTHEQALLFINSLTPMGRNWWNNNLITNYRMVKNIPFEFFDRNTEINIEAYFPKNYFEYQENNNFIHSIGSVKK